jgi:hypothetical protein
MQQVQKNLEEITMQSANMEYFACVRRFSKIT